MKSKYNNQLERWDKQYIWHPFTQMSDWMSEPITIIKKARGNYLYDTEGKKYFDAVSSLWVNLHGHNNPQIISGLKRQMGKLLHSTFLGLSNVPAIELAKQLIDIVPKNLTRVFYSDNGSTAVEVALKMAYQYWLQKGFKNKTRFLTLKNAYHGDTIGSVSVGGVDLFHGKFKKLLFKTYQAPSPYCYRCEFGKELSYCCFECLKKVENLLLKHHKNIAGCIVEPHIQAAGGMIVMPSGYMKGLEKLCKKYGVLLILDEVATGFGRTGKLFASEIENIKPNIMCLSKGITGGYLPLAVTLTEEHIFKAFCGAYEEFKTFFHGHSYTANPLACAAALANLDYMKKNKVIEGIQPKIELLSLELLKLKDLEIVGDIRQLGLMAAVELVPNKLTKSSFPTEKKVGIRVCMEMRKKGYFIRPLGSVIVIMPPLSSTESELSRLVSDLKDVMLNFCY